MSGRDLGGVGDRGSDRERGNGNDNDGGVAAIPSATEAPESNGSHGLLILLLDSQFRKHNVVVTDPETLELVGAYCKDAWNELLNAGATIAKTQQYAVNLHGHEYKFQFMMDHETGVYKVRFSIDGSKWSHTTAMPRDENSSSSNNNSNSRLAGHRSGGNGSSGSPAMTPNQSTSSAAAASGHNDRRTTTTATAAEAQDRRSMIDDREDDGNSARGTDDRSLSLSNRNKKWRQWRKTGGGGGARTIDEEDQEIDETNDSIDDEDEDEDEPPAAAFDKAECDKLVYLCVEQFNELHNIRELTTRYLAAYDKICLLCEIAVAKFSSSSSSTNTKQLYGVVGHVVTHGRKYELRFTRSNASNGIQVYVSDCERLAAATTTTDAQDEVKDQYQHDDETATATADARDEVVDQYQHDDQVPPMGLAPAPSIFQENMNKTLGDLDFVDVYNDDTLILSDGKDSDEGHRCKREEVLGRLESMGIRANLRK